MSDAPERIWLYVDTDDDGGRYLELIRPDAECSTDVPYILATPAALAASPEVQRMIREAEARGMERADALVQGMSESRRIRDGLVARYRPHPDAVSTAIRAEAAAIRGEGK